MAIQLPPLHQRIILDPTGVKGGAAAYTKSMSGAQKASTAAGNATAKMGTAINTMAFRAQTAGRTLLKNFALPIGAIGALAIKSFGEFERSMLKIEALVGVSAGQVERFGDAVKAASQETGRGPQELADAMFFVASAGLRGATAMEVLRASAKGAALGLGQTKVVADAATSAVNAYGAENLSGSEAVDVLTAAVREGKVEANRLAPAIGKAIPVASAMGIEFHEVAAAIAAMTRTGTDARTSAIQLRQIMQSLLDPSRQATKAMKEMGIAEGELRRQAEEEGLLAVLKRLRDLAAENADTFADVFPNIRALAGALDITGANLTENEGIFRALANSVGDTDEAFQKASKGALFKFNKATADLKVSMLGLGESMVPLLNIIIGVIGVVSSLVTVISTEAMGKFLAMVVGITAAVGLLMITIGKTVAVVQGLSFAMLNLATTTGAAAVAMAALQAVMALSGVILLVGMIGALVVGLTGLGKHSESAAKELADLSGEIRDVRQMGERSIRPIHMFADALKSLTGAAADPKIIQDFNAAFADMIEKAGDLSSLGGQIQAEESILQAFFGSLAGEEDQAVIDEMVENFDMLLARFRVQFQDADFFTRMFGDAADVDAALLLFLQGDDAEGVADKQAGLWADRIRGTFQGAINTAFSRLGKGGPAGAIPIEAVIIQAAGSVEDALGDISQLFNKALLSGNPEVAMNIYTELMDNLVDTTNMTAQEGEIAMAVYEKAFMDSLHAIDAFTEDSGKGIDDLSTLFLTLAEDQDAVLKGDFTGRDNVVAFAEQYAVKLREITREIETANRMGTGELFGLDSTDAHRLALEEAMRVVQALNDELADLEDTGEEAFDTITGALVEMEKGFSKADEAAKELDERFDNLMGRGIGLEESQLDFNDGLRDMVDALDESGGSISAFTSKGSDARRELLAMIGNAEEVAQNMLAMGFSMEETEAHFDSLAGAITANALGKGINEGELKALFKNVNFTGDAMSVMFADPDDKASDALMDAAEGIADKTGPFVFKAGLDIGENMLQGFTRGLRGGTEELRTNTREVFGALILQVKEIFGITSPSVLFRDEIGKPLMQGITVGFAEEAMASKGQWKNILRSFINDAISTTKSNINSASSAVNAILDLEEATQKLAKAKRDHDAIDGGPGKSRREGLSERQLQRRVDEAKRALRLGQGHQEDLEMALLDAEEALADFGQNVDSDSPVIKAELDLMDAGLAVAAASAQMKMDGDDATEAFTNMAEAVGISTDKIKDLLAVPMKGQNIFEELFSDNVQQAIEDVANGLGWVSSAKDELGDGDDDGLIFPALPNVQGGEAGEGFQQSSEIPQSMLAGLDSLQIGDVLGGVTLGPPSVGPAASQLPFSPYPDVSTVVTGDNATHISGPIEIHVAQISDLNEIGAVVDGWGASIGSVTHDAETSGILNSADKKWVG